MSLTQKAYQFFKNSKPVTFVFCLGMAIYIFSEPNQFSNSNVYESIVFILWGVLNVSIGIGEGFGSKYIRRDHIPIGVLIVVYGVFMFLTVSSEIPRLALTLAFVAVGVYEGFRVD